MYNNYTPLFLNMQTINNKDYHKTLDINNFVPTHNFYQNQPSPFINFYSNNNTMNFQYYKPWDMTQTSTNYKTENTYEELIKEKKEKYEKQQENNIFKTEQGKAILEQQKIINECNQIISETKKGEKKDGSTVVNLENLENNEDKDKDKTKAEKKEKKGFWSNALKWTGSAITSLTNTTKSFFGMDKDGWNPKKCAKNLTLAIGAGLACSIPVIGPAIGYTLLAGGIIGAAIGVKKGISDLDNAKTIEEKERARQNICSSTIIGLASTFGMKGLGRCFSNSVKASGVAETSRIATLAKTRTSLLGKCTQYVSQTLRDITINPIRATIKSIKIDIARFSKYGLMQTWIKNLKTATNNISDNLKTYDSQYNSMVSNLKNRIKVLEEGLKTETNINKKALLLKEKQLLQNNLNELRTIKKSYTKKSQFDDLKRYNSNTQNSENLATYQLNSNGKYELTYGRNKNTYEIDAKTFNDFKKTFAETETKYQKDLNELITLKENSMRSKASFGRKKKNEAELEEYVSDHKLLKEIYKTKKQAKKRISELKNQIKEYDVKLKDNAISGSEKIRIKTEKNIAEQELTQCQNLFYKSNAESLVKNDYLIIIGGANRQVKMKLLKNTMTAPATQLALLYSNKNREFSIPLISTELKEYSKDEKENLIKTLEENKQKASEIIDNLRKIKTVEEWNSLQEAQLAQQA